MRIKFQVVDRDGASYYFIRSTATETGMMNHPLLFIHKVLEGIMERGYEALRDTEFGPLYVEWIPPWEIKRVFHRVISDEEIEREAQKGDM